MDTDEEQLNLLSIFHYVIAVIVGLMAFFPIIHLIFGVGMVTFGSELGAGGANPPAAFGWFFILIALGTMASFAVAALCVAYAGACLGRRQKRTFCFVVAAVMCAFFPFGTVLGVFTIIVLSRDSVRAMFERPSALK